MCCILACSSVLGPRIAFLLTWIFTDLVTRAFQTFWWPLLGLLFAPWTALTYVLAYDPVKGVTGFGIFFVGLGIIADIASYTSGYRTRNDRPSFS